MSTTATCPRCCRTVSLPAAAEPSVMVRCPLCRSEYRLQEAVDYIPPSLEVVLEPTPQRQEPAPAAAPPFSWSPEPASVGIGGVRTAPTLEAFEEIPLASDAGMTQFPAARDMPIGRDFQLAGLGGMPLPIPPRPEPGRSLLAEGLKIVLANILAFVIGYSILIWGFKVDPFHLAKNLPPAMLPESLQP